MKEGSTPERIILDQQVEIDESQDSLYGLGPEHRDLSETFDTEAPKEIDREIATLIVQGMKKDLAKPRLDPSVRSKLERITADFAALGVVAPDEKSAEISSPKPMPDLGPIDQNHPSSSS